MAEENQFREWAIVEVMGHRSFGGLVSEQTVGGSSFIRVDIPESGDRAAFTKLFSASSIYCISPTTEELARGYQAARGSLPPVNRYDLPAQTALLETQADLDSDDEEW